MMIPCSFSILAIFKNESANIIEWLEHYISMGVTLFYLIDNGSTDNYRPLILPYLHMIKLYRAPEKHKQVQHYNTVYHFILQENPSTWLFVVDLDEFAFPLHTQKITQALSHISDDINEIIIPEYAFGSSGYLSQPTSIRTSFVFRQPDTLSFKSIFRIKQVAVGEVDIHQTKKKWKTYDGSEIFRINHYLIQSAEYFSQVIATRGDAMYAWNKKTWDYFYKHDNPAVLLDTDLRDRLFL
jgi:hypothetical protein